MTTLAQARWLLIALAFLAAFSNAAAAQELEPRAYSASPVGTTFAVLDFARSSGEATIDPQIPLPNIHGTFYISYLGLGQTFPLFGRQALFTAALPYSWGNISGDVGERANSVHRSGLANVKARISVNLRGCPAMSPKEFASTKHHNLIIATSLSLDAPSGQYSGAKLINLGTNRWALKPEVGVSWPVKNFYLDLYAGVWFYTTNSDFFPGGNYRMQNSLTALQAHVSYNVRRNLWVAIDSTWYGGGASTVDSRTSERQSNSRLGATLSLPLPKRQSLKIAYSSGVTATVGGNFDTVSISWQHVWFDHH